MKNSSKKALEQRGIVSAGRAAATPGARAHDDKRRANRKTDKQRLKREVQLETARKRGPFPFGRSRFRKTKCALITLSLAALLWLIYTVVRSRILLANGRAIGRQSEGFARDYFVGEIGLPAVTYLAMGDSTAAGWGAGTLEATYPYRVAQALAARGLRVHVVAVAVGGATVNDVKTRQLGAIHRVRPDWITLSVGANDATHFTASAPYRRDLSAILSALEASSARAIAVADTPDMFLAPALPLPIAIATARRARAQNAITRELTRDSRVQIVPLYDKGKLDARRNPALYAADRFHPSALGYARWAQLFVEQLKTGGAEA